MGTCEIPELDHELSVLDQVQGPYREPRVLQGEQAAVTVFDGRRVINLTANNYLGLATHPKLKKAAVEAIERCGVAVCSSREDAGTMDLHLLLERRIAEFLAMDAALVLLSNSEANWAVIGSLLSEKDLAIVDEDSHASVLDGIRISGASHQVYRHLDMDSLELVLHKTSRQGYRRVLVSTAGVFPTYGEIAPLPAVVELAVRYGASTMVDDAHAVGVIGPSGRGTVSHFGMEGQCDIITGGFPKAPGVIGGYVACSRKLRELIVRKSNMWLHTQPQPAAMIAASIAALEVLESPEGEELIGTAWRNAEFFRARLRELGFRIPEESRTPLVPIQLDSTEDAFRLSQGLFREGVFVGFRPRDSLRTIVTAAHTREDLESAVRAFEKVGKEMGIGGSSRARAKQRVAFTGRRLVTEADLQNVPLGSEVTLPPHALITPLARDLARERQLTLVANGSAAAAVSTDPSPAPAAGSASVTSDKTVALGADHGG